MLGNNHSVYDMQVSICKTVKSMYLMAGSKKGHKGWIFSTIELFEGKIAQLLSSYNFCDKITKDNQPLAHVSSVIKVYFICC